MTTLETRPDETETADPLGGLHIVDGDAHFTEPADLWTSRVPASLQDKVPQMRTVDGKTAWYLHDELWASTGGNTIATDGEKILGSHVVQPFDRVDVSAWHVKERLAILDKMGIWAQILYPNGIGFASNHVFAIEDDAERTQILQTYNDFLVDVQHEAPTRLFPQALLPIWDMDLCVKEMTRLLDQGITGFTLSDKPELLGLPELPEPFFDPMWDLFNESGAVANFHIGAGNRREEFEALRNSKVGFGYQEFPQTVIDAKDAPRTAAPTWRSFGRQRRLAVHATQMYMSNVRIIVNFCMSNLFDRYPNLKVVSAESGIGWIPFILEAMEYQFDEMVTEPEEVNLTKRRPAEYFRDHIWVMFWFEELAAKKQLEDIGINNVLVETDIPHPTCLYPSPREHFARVLGGVSDHAKRRILQDNGGQREPSSLS
jgi:predicted TIM-barrel fold metal-dependent hydrolase